MIFFTVTDPRIEGRWDIPTPNKCRTSICIVIKSHFSYFLKVLGHTTTSSNLKIFIRRRVKQDKDLKRKIT